MLCTPMKTKELSIQEWKTVFPDFTTLEGSRLFIKKLIAVSLSSITFIRRIFPEEAYGEMDLNGIKIKLLKEDTGIKAVSKFIDLIRSCYDAVEKKYLERMSIGICPNPDKKDEVVEAYNLVFRYTEDECSIICHNGLKAGASLQHDPTVNATFLMLKSVTAVSDLLGTLPKHSYITVKLLYYDDVTPPDYEPNGFEPSDHEKFTFTGKTMNLQLGKIDTDQHRFKLLLKTTACKQAMSQCNSAVSTWDDTTITVDESEQVSDENALKNDYEIKESQTRNGTVRGKSDNPMQCPCQHKCTDDSDTITCASCERKQHKICYGILKSVDIPPVFYCVDCILHNSDGKTPLDLIYAYHGKDRQELCSMRRAINLCRTLKNLTKINLEKVLGCSKVASKVLIERLEFEGFIKEGPGKNRYTVEKSNVNSRGLSHYFSSKENIENVEQLNLFEEDIIEEPAMEPISDSSFGNKIVSPKYSTSLLDSSINRVRALSLNNMSPAKEVRCSQKRKSSSKAISPAASDELFRSQKRPRTKKLSRKCK